MGPLNGLTVLLWKSLRIFLSYLRGLIGYIIILRVCNPDSEKFMFGTKMSISVGLRLARFVARVGAHLEFKKVIEGTTL